MADLSSFQVRRGWRVSVASPLGGDLADWVRRSAAHHVVWEAARSPGPAVAGEVLRLARIVASVDPDVVHLHSAKAGLVGRLVVRGRRPTVFQPHAWSFHAAEGVVGRAARRWERRAARWSAAIVCVSDAEKHQGEHAGIRARWFVIPNGVDLARFRPLDRAAARAELGIDASPVVVCVGRLARQKGQDLLLAAWNGVLAEVPDARLALVGGGPDEATLRRAAPDRVSFVGVSDAVERWLAAADVIALPSRWEGMSLSMLEALAAGRSIVSSDVPGAREALGEDAGAVVPVEDPGALRRAIVERLRSPDLRAREEAAARARAEARFSLDASLERMMEVYAAVGGRRRQP